jgi:hypothetical protein
LVNQQHLLDLLQHLSYGIESSSSAVEGEKILNINELASRLNVSEDKLSRLLSSKNMTAEQVDNPAKEAQIARELNSGIATTSTTAPAPVKAPQQQPAKTPGGCESAKPATKPPAPTMTPAELVERQRMAAFTAATAGVQLQTALIEGANEYRLAGLEAPLAEAQKKLGEEWLQRDLQSLGELTSGIENYANQAHQASLDILTIDAQVTYLALGAAE